MRSLRVLVAEDDPDSAEILQTVFESWGHVVEVATDGRRALQAIARCVPDLVILDFAMPILNGGEVVRALRKTPERCDVPIIIVSAFDDPQLGSDVLGYMQKPVDIEAIREIVRHVARGAVPTARSVLRALREVCSHCGARTGAWCRTGARHAPQLHSVRVRE